MAPNPDRTENPLVLVVDDDAALRLLVVTALMQHEFEVVEATSGAEALAQINTRRPDVILLDVMMPEMNGYDTCAAIRADDGVAHVPILMMTGLDDVNSIDRAYDAGGTDFITKPVNYAVLPHRVRYMLRAARDAAALRDSEMRLQRAQSMARLGYWEWDFESGRLVCSELVETWFDCISGSHLESSDALLCNVHPDDRERFKNALRVGFADRSPVRLGYRIVINDKVLHLVQDATFTCDAAGNALSFTGVVQDISERVNAQQAAHALRHFDQVTGLPNRFAMTRNVDRAIARAQQRGTSFAVMTLDLDQFGRVNDTLGHAVGDGVLREVAARLTDCIRDSIAPGTAPDSNVTDAVARFDGDEFVMLLNPLNTQDDASRIAQRIRRTLITPMSVEGEDIVLSASIGISMYPDDGTSAEALFARAGAALSEAKREGRDRDQIFTATLDARAFKRFTLESNLRKALEAEQFELWYQPKIHAPTGAVSGAEALVRWRHPELGMISPAEFIPVAEDCGLIVPLGAWVAAAACRQLDTWSSTALGQLNVAINLSPVQFADPAIEHLLFDCAARYPQVAKRLELEVTESVIVNELDQTLALLHRLKAAHFKIWIDDFGTGYSSMSYLKSLPVDGLKIDQSFVLEMHQHTSDAAIVRAVCMLAQGLELKLIAEGVERAEHVDTLTGYGCDYLQGYYFSRPLPAKEFAAWVSARQQAPLATAHPAA